MPDTPAAPLLTRRRVLAGIGVLAVGAAVAAEIELGGGQGSSGITAGPMASASASGASPAAGNTSAPSQAPGASPSAPPPARRSYRSRPDITSPVIDIITVAGIPAPGLVFLTPADGLGKDGPTIVDGAGELVWMRPDNNVFATDLRVASFRGAPVLTWWEGANNAGIGAGEHVVMDAAYREVMRIPGQSGRKADLHELQLTDAGTALFFADTPMGPGPLPASVGTQPAVMDCAIQEVDLATGKLVFEWHAVDHIAVSESVIDPPTGANQVWDYFHGNSIEVDTDGHLIVSARNTSAVYKIDRATGQVLWRLGGKRSDFAMGQGTAFALQHDARRQADGTITIFDDNQAPNFSRGIVLRADESAKTVTLVREYPQPQRLLATSQGNVQVLPNGHVFIGWGSVPRYSEFTADGRLVYDAVIASTMSYRNRRHPWVGRPSEPPAVAIDTDGSAKAVYASWNGATEVARWDVLAGATASTLRKVASAPRTGFETVIAVTGLGAADVVVAVRAHDAAGTELGTSAPVAVPA